MSVAGPYLHDVGQFADKLTRGVRHPPLREACGRHGKKDRVSRHEACTYEGGVDL